MSTRAPRIPVAFVADVPSLGYGTYYVLDGPTPPATASPLQIDLAQNAFENGSHRIKFDRSTGGIQSILDKRTQKELVRQGGKYQCNELVVFEDDDADIGLHLTGKQWRMREHPSTIRVIENGPVRLVIEVAGRLLHQSTRGQEIILYRDLPRIDLVTTVDWEGKRNVHLCQVFPLDLPDPRVRYPVPYGWQEYGKEMKYAAPWPFGPVAGYRWRGVRGWLELTNETTSVTLASECNYTAFKDLGAQPEAGYLIQPLLLRTVRSCGNGNLYYEQKGKHQFRFSLQSRADPHRLGAELDCPLLRYVMKEASASGHLPDRLSLARVKPDGVQISVVKRAEDGRGLVFRLAEMKGGKEPSRAEIRLFEPVKDAVKTNIIEEDGVGLSPQNDTMVVPIAPLGIETVRVSF